MDFALSPRAPLAGDIGEALGAAGFTRTFLGEGAQPVTHYNLDDEAGFYAEFLVPLEGSEIRRDGKRDVTVSLAGITAQKLRHLDLLLVAPWSVRVASADVPLERPADILLPNPVSFIVQKLLINEKPWPNKQAQDILYIHDTLQLFGGAVDELRALWRGQLRASMPTKAAKRAEAVARTMFDQVTDTIREAARIPQHRALTPEALRAACEYGLSEILGG